MSIAANIGQIRATLPAGVALLCVSKYHAIETIAEAYAAGERMFGESRVQELLQKREALPKDIHWHFIGHLQTNKIRFILPFVTLIHGVDSWRLLTAIEKEATKMQLPEPVRVLLEVKVAQEETKYGFTPTDLLSTLPEQLAAFPHIQICGIMGMASHTDDAQQIAEEFAAIKTIYDQIKPTLQAYYHDDVILSMGMSDDYEIAIAHGSNLIRVGSKIFSEE